MRPSTLTRFVALGSLLVPLAAGAQHSSLARKTLAISTGDGATISPATDTIMVGHPALRRGTVREGVDTSEVFAVQNGQRHLISTLVQSVRATGSGYLVVQRSESPRGVSLDSITIARGTFAPLKHIEVTPDGWHRLVYDGRHLTGEMKDSTGEHAVNVQLGRAVLDNSVVAIVSDVLPLAPGYAATIVAYDIGGFDRVANLRVVGAEQVTYRGHQVDAWKVEMDFGKWVATRWVDRATHRELQWTLKVGEREMWGMTK